MKVAVVTPFFNTPQEWLDQCIESVQNQTHPCTHFLVSDGNTAPIFPKPDNIQVIQLPKPHADVGNLARAVGSISAISQGFDAIAYLDSDNWYQPHHIESLVRLQQHTQAAVCTCNRTLHHLDGSLLGLCMENDGHDHVDTSCLFLTRPAFGLVAVWYLMEPQHGAVGDRIFWNNLKAWNLSHAHSHLPTVAFRTNYRIHYQSLGLEPPLTAKAQVPWPPVGLPGIPIWSAIAFSHYQPVQPPPPLNKEAIQATLTAYKLRMINLILFPDWLQTEDALQLELANVLQALVSHPQSSQITLLIEASQVDQETANLLVWSVAMLVFQDELATPNQLEISILGKLDPFEWSAIAPHISYKISLKHEDRQRVADMNLIHLPEVHLSIRS
jgi:hypothetical protein